MSTKSAPVAKSAAKAGHNRISPDPARSPDKIRTVALVGRSGSGKTTLTEQLLAAGGVIGRPGTIADGSTVSDSDPIEIAQQRSVFLSANAVRVGATTVNLVDTPGFADFVPELRAGLRAADGVLFVVSAEDGNAGLDDITRALWEECSALGMPRAVVVDKLDAARADLTATIAACSAEFGAIGGNAVLPIFVPSDSGTDLIDLLGATDDAQASPRAALIEAIIAESEDESLLDRYLAGEDIDRTTLIDDLHSAVLRGHFHPVLPVCATTGLGVPELLRIIVEGFPSPAESRQPMAATLDGDAGATVACDPDGPLVAEVIRTWLDTYLGRVALVRVFSGSLRADAPVHLSGHGRAASGHPDHDSDLRVAQVLNTALEPVERVVAGDLCVIARLSDAEAGDTLSDPDKARIIAPWPMPEPLLPLAVRAATRNGEDSLARALARCVAVDPCLRLDQNARTGQTVVWCLGEAHGDVVLSRLRAGGAQVDMEPVRVELRASFGGPARGHGRQVKQSGGHGQYAVCDIEVEPLPRGAGVEFVDRVVGGAVPSQFIGSVEKGVRHQLEQGLLDTPGRGAAIAVTDVRISLVDGKAHSVDSSDAAFQFAGALAVRDAATHAAIQLLEPIDSVTISVPDEYIGAVLSDLAGRRGRVTGTEPIDTERPRPHTAVHAEVPQAELVRYPITLRSLTGGSGTFVRQYGRHDPVPEALASRLIS